MNTTPLNWPEEGNCSRRLATYCELDRAQEYSTQLELDCFLAELNENLKNPAEINKTVMKTH